MINPYIEQMGACILSTCVSGSPSTHISKKLNEIGAFNTVDQEIFMLGNYHVKKL